MIELGLVNSELKRYIEASRGPGAEYLLYPTDRMGRFFGDVLETFQPVGVDLSGVKLVFVNSHLGDVEHLHLQQGSCIIFDQSLLEILGLVSDSALQALSLGTPPKGPSLSILSAFYAARNLSLGKISDAVDDASLCYSLRKQDATPYPADEQRRNVWAELQGCFTIAHEVMHTKAEDSDDSVLASYLVADYETRMLPHARKQDQKNGSPSGEWRDQWRLVAGTEGSWAPEVVAPTINWESRLKWVLETQDGFGQEVICDYSAALAVSRNLGGSLLSTDECLLACYVALVGRACMTAVERRIIAYTSSVPTLEETLRIATELGTRIKLLRLALVPLSRNGAYKDISRTVGEDGSDQVRDLVNAQWAQFDRTLRRLDEVWTTPIVKLAGGGRRPEAHVDDREFPMPGDLEAIDLRRAQDYVRRSVGVNLRML